MKVWVTRAEPGASATAERLRGMGHAPLVAPLLEVRALALPELPPRAVALAFTSRNGVSAVAGQPDVAPWLERPVFAVGETTAVAARGAGFTDVRSADGDVQALSALIAGSGVSGLVLHLSAREPAGELASGPHAEVRRIAVYDVVELPPSAEVTEAWPELDAVLIHSPRAARTLAAARASLGPSSVPAVCISEQAAAPLRLTLGEVRVADAPNEAALLARLGKAAGAG